MAPIEHDGQDHPSLPTLQTRYEKKQVMCSKSSKGQNATAY